MYIVDSYILTVWWKRRGGGHSQSFQAAYLVLGSQARKVAKNAKLIFFVMQFHTDYVHN